MDIEQIIMNIIIYSGDARNYMYEALTKAREEKYDEIDGLIKQANDAIGNAHDIQTSMLQKEASGEPLKVSILFVHAQDQLMTTISEKNLITEMIEMTKSINAVSNKLK